MLTRTTNMCAYMHDAQAGNRIFTFVVQHCECLREAILCQLRTRFFACFDGFVITVHGNS